LKDELTVIEPFAWALYGFGVGLNTMSYVSAPITLLSTIAYIAILFGFGCTVAMAAKGWKKFVDKNYMTKEKLVVGRKEDQDEIKIACRKTGIADFQD